MEDQKCRNPPEAGDSAPRPSSSPAEPQPPTHKLHVARKRFGQHFLCDALISARMVTALHPAADERIIEIGPGTGALTRPLLARLRAVGALPLHAIEIDRDLAARLRREFDTGNGNLKNTSAAATLCVHEADVLQVDWSQQIDGHHSTFVPGARGQEAAARSGEAEAKGPPARPMTPPRLIGNLPYNISTPLLLRLAHRADAWKDAIFMVQKEVALRLAAAPGSREYGRLSIMVGYHCAVELLFEVPPSAFNPPPKVNSTVLRLTPRPYPRVVRDFRCFEQLVAQAFSQRRKMLRNTLAGWCDADTLLAQGIAPTARAEALAIDDYIRLANALAASGQA